MNEASHSTLLPASANPDGCCVSVIIRCHKPDRLPLLDETLFSLAIQEWQEIEPVIVLQNGTEQFRQAVASLIERQPWLNRPSHQILLVPFPKGKDGRGSMLMEGIQAARGRYLAFLDDDDYVYHHAYRTLIHRLTQTDCAIAVGGVRTATMTFDRGSWFVVTKAAPFAWGSSQSDLLFDNFIPIHSYVIDRTRIHPEDLLFDDEAAPLEDYEFLLRLAAKYEFDLAELRTPVCEYRLHAGNSVTRAAGYTHMVSPEVLRARQNIFKRKREIQLAIPISQWLEVRRMLTRGLSRSAPQPGRDRLLYKLADRFYSSLDRHPDLAKGLGRISYKIKKALGVRQSGCDLDWPRKGV